MKPFQALSVRKSSGHYEGASPLRGRRRRKPLAPLREMGRGVHRLARYADLANLTLPSPVEGEGDFAPERAPPVVQRRPFILLS